MVVDVVEAFSYRCEPVLSNCRLVYHSQYIFSLSFRPCIAALREVLNVLEFYSFIRVPLNLLEFVLDVRKVDVVRTFTNLKAVCGIMFLKEFRILAQNVLEHHLLFSALQAATCVSRARRAVWTRAAARRHCAAGSTTRRACRTCRWRAPTTTTTTTARCTRARRAC